MKKEVIYFDAAAYGPFAKCELTNGYLESVCRNMDEEASGGGKKIKLDEDHIKNHDDYLKVLSKENKIEPDAFCWDS